jgi:uncharacterized protein YecE (DUF72 family)
VLKNDPHMAIILHENINLHFSTCSWNYPEWSDIGVYSKSYDKHYEYLPEYAKKFDTAEVDQWFWSLQETGFYRLPKESDATKYFELTPDNFKFTIKAPNSLTLTHYYKTEIPNEHFLSDDLLYKFTKNIQRLKTKIGVIMFEFEYLNKNKMTSLDDFVSKLRKFTKSFPKDFIFAIETRNPNYLKKEFFEFLVEKKIGFILIDGYYMPPAVKVYDEFSDYIKKLPCMVIRLLGKDRQAIEKKTRKVWNRIVEPRDETLSDIVRIILDFSKMKVPLYVNVNNHFEGSAPLTISKLRALIK